MLVISIIIFPDDINETIKIKQITDFVAEITKDIMIRDLFSLFCEFTHNDFVYSDKFYEFIKFFNGVMINKQNNRICIKKMTFNEFLQLSKIVL